jgi:GNAT superfamily N-acetyltransferase
MAFGASIQFREASSADVSAMVDCRLGDPTAEPADPRMRAYFDGQHNPQQALPERTGYVALENGAVIGYIAGHLTTRHGCAGEVQYLFVARAFRRRGIATKLIDLLARWFEGRGALKVCVAVAADSPREARPFLEGAGAAPLKKNWHGWDDISMVTSKVLKRFEWQ